ncbi:DUF1566 domain-containing protein [Dysgonomonas sp. 521]|nr:DUF1566 domain-containing protein [Dysgonomonas sp. 521]
MTETGGCTSPAATITLSNESSAVPTVILNRSAEEPNKGDVVTYTADINFGPATAYKWTVTGDATIQSGGGNTSFAVVKFSATGTTATVKVEVSNACGTGIGQHVVTMKDDCVSPISVSPSADSKQTTFVNTEVTLGKVSASFASGAPTVSYQWYRSADGGATYAPISGETGNSYVAKESTAGTYKYYCEVGNGSGCTGSTPMNSGVYTVDVVESLAIGKGTFIGTTCFDVVESNFGDGCGTQASRTSQKADFSKPATNTQTYTFKTNGTDKVSNIRFIHVNTNGDIIEDITPGNTLWATTTNLSGTFTVSVKYRDDLNKDKLANGAGGLDRDQALKAELYVVYNNKADGTGTDVMLKLDISVQDCTCCPGYLAIGGEYTVLPSVLDAKGYLKMPTDSKWDVVSAKFTATGKDVCFYKTDAVNSKGMSILGNWYKDGCGNGFAGALSYIEAEHRAMGWRFPTVAELGALQSIHDTLSTQPTSAPDTQDLRTSLYWGSTEYSATVGWNWSFTYQYAHRVSRTGGTVSYARCVRSF